MFKIRTPVVSGDTQSRGRGMLQWFRRCISRLPAITDEAGRRKAPAVCWPMSDRPRNPGVGRRWGQSLLAMACGRTFSMVDSFTTMWYAPAYLHSEDHSTTCSNRFFRPVRRSSLRGLSDMQACQTCRCAADRRQASVFPQWGGQRPWNPAVGRTAYVPPAAVEACPAPKRCGAICVPRTNAAARIPATGTTGPYFSVFPFPRNPFPFPGPTAPPRPRYTRGRPLPSNNHSNPQGPPPSIS